MGVKCDCQRAVKGGDLPYNHMCKMCRAELDAKIRNKLMRPAPSECGPEIGAQIAPARGPVVAFQPVQMMPDPKSKDGYKAVDAGYRGRSAARSRDVFDKMTEQGQRRGGAVPFTAHQVSIAREYRDLTEWVASSGIKGSAVFDDKPRGRGLSSDFMDRYMMTSDRLGRFHQAIGEGVAKQDRPAAHPARVGKVVIGEVKLKRVGRGLITVRALVDYVCLSDLTFSAVLDRFGWNRSGANIKTLRGSMCEALDRMLCI